MTRLLTDRPQLGPILVMAVCLAALGTAFASEVWGGLKPCILCIYQRYVYGAAFLIGLAGLALSSRPALVRLSLWLAGLTFLVGVAIAFFHVGVEQHWWRGTADCHAPVIDPNLSVDALRQQLLNTDFVPCDQIPWSLFGISMAGYNTAAYLVLALAAIWAARALKGRRTA